MVLIRMRCPSARSLLICALALLVAVMFQGSALAAKQKQKTFSTPEAAVEELVKALRDGSEKELLAIFGPGSEPLISSGDKVDDRERREEFVRLHGEANRLEPAGDKKRIVHPGKNDWPFPIIFITVARCADVPYSKTIHYAPAAKKISKYLQKGNQRYLRLYWNSRAEKS